jgi:ABC-type lipoprotein export system ATPase subunit/GNAT superfamily N-acetyltransferase
MRAGDVVYITGDSGSGKSVLLRALKADLGSEAGDMTLCHVASDQPLIETVGRTVEEGLELLSRVGLNDAFLFLRTYDQLSDGQKYRYRLAKLIESGCPWWLCDEFCSTLDRDTAKIVAFNVQKLARALGKTVVMATTHADLLGDLGPDVVIHKRFGKEISVTYHGNVVPRECSLVQEMRVEPGTIEDWHGLCGFHYRSHQVRSVRRIFRLVRLLGIPSTQRTPSTRGTQSTQSTQSNQSDQSIQCNQIDQNIKTAKKELCGVIVYGYPPIGAQGRGLVLPKMGIQELNKKLSIISRVVVHPKYRSLGLGAYLIRESLPLVGTDVEMVAVMAKYNPFAEKAGMRRILEQQPSPEVKRISGVLASLGFNLQLLSSYKIAFSQLETLSPEQLASFRAVLKKNGVPRLQKELIVGRQGRFYAKSGEWRRAVESAGLSGLARVIRVVGLLLQVKVYLFWRK